MKKSTRRAACIVGALVLVTAACGSDDDSSSDTPEGTEAPAGSDAPAGTEAPAGTDAPAAGGGKVGFILPDSASSVRWESFDRPLIEAACADAGLECDIQNAEGDKNNMATIADQMIADGVG